MKTQRGVALLTALILLALTAMLAVKIGFDSALTARRSTATLGMEQALALTQGSEALAAYALAEDEDKKQDTLTESWAQPYGPVEVVPEVGIEAQLFDEQGKFNLNTLLKPDGKPDEDAMLIFKRMLELLEIEPYWASQLVDWLDPDVYSLPEGGEDSLYASQLPPYRTANLLVSSVSELEQLPGFGRERYLKLLPHVTALPPTASTINVCTASPVVLDALFALSQNNSNNVEFTRMLPEEFAKSREAGCFPPLSTLTDGEIKVAQRTAETSSFFRLRTGIRIGSARFALYSLMYRNADNVRPIARTFGTD
ncbi:MAG: type II secretion system minor pseudopilin GspK [Nevskiaceae bacterium]|jgi:general secretion pathway protein K|nr:type II secretion system minor pseudopilin GspK [Nevskiaceae bacterium]